MKTSLKTIQDANTLHDLRTYTGSIRKSAKPALPTTAILDLHMRRSERDRILKELKVLKKRKQRLQTHLKEVEKEMTTLLSQATRTALEIRGKKAGEDGSPARRGKLVLEY